MNLMHSDSKYSEIENIQTPIITPMTEMLHIF